MKSSFKKTINMHESFFDQKKKHINNILLKNWKLNGKYLRQMENLPRRSLRASETHLGFNFFYINKKMIYIK